MARPLRIEFAGALYHVTSRGNRREPIFNDDRDRESILCILAELHGRFGWVIHAYCLMSNHYHLLIETPKPNLSAGMRHLNGVYTQRFNRRHNRCGHVFQGRFHSVLVEKDSHLLELSRYIVMNPVAANLVQQIGEWRWSSYRDTVGMRRPPPWLCVEWLLSQFGNDLETSQARYSRFVASNDTSPHYS